MNILKIKEALIDAQQHKKIAEADADSSYYFWDGYEAALTYALLHLDQGEQHFYD